MKEFNVSVERNYYITGLIKIKAKTPQEAIKKINKRIKSYKLCIISPEIKWNDDLDYIDGSFKTTGDVE